jgi:hypothetical protein
MELFQAEKWLLEQGLISETSADTLVMYGYMAPYATRVSVRVDLDTPNQGRSPSVEYRIGIPRFRHILYSLCRGLESGGVLRKAALLVLLALGAPVPGSIESFVRGMALNLLPRGFEVRVYVEPH